jgi:CubicO group peptidase (beta-lactamase class C family)
MKLKLSMIGLLLVASAACVPSNAENINTAAPAATGGPAVQYDNFSEIPESARPNNATISLYEDNRRTFLQRLISGDNAYRIRPSGNAAPFLRDFLPESATIERELSEGYLLSYLYYENGAIRYDGLPPRDRFSRPVNNDTLFFTHSTGKSIVSYIVGHAICEGYIDSADEIIDWPLMENTVYDGQSLQDLLNMSAGDSHVVTNGASRVVGANTHHRDMGIDTIANYLQGTERRGGGVFYNNALTDIIASYVAYRAGDNYDQLLRRVFQDKIRIENDVYFEQHRRTLTEGRQSPYYGELQTRASYSFLMTREDFLRVAIAMMQDYQQQTCVGKYLRNAQDQVVRWPKYRPGTNNAQLWLHNYAADYGSQFYFDFNGMRSRNIIATEGYNGQNIMIDLDNSRIVVTNSAATGWDQRTFVLNVIRDGELPR